MATLYLVSTPIGNLKDISERAQETLKSVDLLLAEDTRKTGLLLQHFGIQAKMLSFHEHNEEARIPEVLATLAANHDVALVSDAGTPSLSDPGFKLVRSAAASGYTITAVPGASALLAALVVSGLPTEHFIYLGYLPKKDGKAETLLKNAKEAVGILAATIVIFESPHRLFKTMEKLSAIFPGADISVARELTKIHEEIVRGKMKDVNEILQKLKPKGEYTLVLRN